MSEIQHHIDLIMWAKTHPILNKYLIHIPNGGKRSKREARKLKLMGVKKGVSDLFLAYPNKIYHGMWQELKTRKGILSIEQKEWIMAMRKFGYAAEVVKSVEESIDILILYLQNKYKPYDIEIS